ncbi:MAG: hypothetical protein GTO13_12965 [Proteobacteria bacterium]|nr:hypothetical protein [Pseudomonadota bacterium]
MHRKMTRFIVIPGQDAPKHTSLCRRNFFKRMGFICLGSLPILGGWGLVRGKTEDLVLAGEVKIPEQAKEGVVPKASIPPIDASAPTRTETATFALG